MSDANAISDAPEGRAANPARMAVLLGLALAGAGAGAGFLAVQQGLLGPAQATAPDEPTPGPQVAPDLEFVEIEPLLISLKDTTVADYLRFRVHLEVAADRRAEVERLEPRIVDLMNGYLRALQPADFEDPLILPQLRSQLLRRLQIIAGEDSVNDVLIMEFVLN